VAGGQAVVDVRLINMTSTEFQAMIDGGTRRYAEENVKVGYWPPGDALQRSKEAHERLLPKGRYTEGHHFYTAFDEEGLEVGHVWIKVEPGEDRRAFIYSVFIKEEMRERGYGKAMMLALEAKARRMKLNALALHVFAYNQTAVGLYRSLGYEVKSLNMMKRL
jgi:ribosomal protein S18 acetylase RimI-like enzyme